MNGGKELRVVLKVKLRKEVMHPYRAIISKFAPT
jgi:hypothetical protein